MKVPHVGWNTLEIRASRRGCSTGIADGAQAYFTHSYAAPVTPMRSRVDHARPAVRGGRGDAIASSACSSIRRSPATAGLQILRNFVTMPEALMLSKRLIACLDVRDGCVVKGVQFEGLRNAGDPAALARRYNVEGIDELVILDVTATLEARRALAETIRAVSRELFIPLAVGGGIRRSTTPRRRSTRAPTRSA